MFALPGSKRVRREELHSPVSSARSSPDPAVEQLLRARIQDEYAFTYTSVDDSANLQDAANSDDDEIELRLFAAPANGAPSTNKIRISSPGAENSEPGLTVKKPHGYYFAHNPTKEENASLQAAALDGTTVLEMSKLAWPGCTLPWKVRHISAAGIKREVLVGHPPVLVNVEETSRKRTRKSKKTRIAIRKKREATKDKREEQARLAKEKEEAEREKRTRRNREKKVKKKAREQAKKAGAADGIEQGETTQKDKIEE